LVRILRNCNAVDAVVPPVAFELLLLTLTQRKSLLSLNLDSVWNDPCGNALDFMRPRGGILVQFASYKESGEMLMQDMPQLAGSHDHFQRSWEWWPRLSRLLRLR